MFTYDILVRQLKHKFFTQFQGFPGNNKKKHVMPFYVLTYLCIHLKVQYSNNNALNRKTLKALNKLISLIKVS